MSNTLDLAHIPRICKAMAGLKKVSLTSMSNINKYSPQPEILNPALVFSIYFRISTGGYKEKSQRTAAGSYIDQSITFFTPKKRFDVQYIIQQLLDNRCAVVHESYDGDTDVMLDASMSYEYSTGVKRTDRNGTDFLFTAKTRRKEQLSITKGDLIDPTLDPDDPIDLPDGGPLGGGGDGPLGTGGAANGGNNYPSYFVEIVPTPITTTPTPSGNTTNLNQFVTAADGLNYFIDYLGNSMQFSSFPKYHQHFGPADFVGNTVTVTVADLPTDDIRIQVLQNGRKKELGATTLNVEQYSRSGQTLTFFRLTAKSTVDIYF